MMITKFAISLVLVYLICIFFVSDISSKADANNMTTNYLILDCDTGTDDAWALFMLIKSEQIKKNVKILGVTTVNGNTKVDNALKNTLRVLKAADRLNIPVFKGSMTPILNKSQSDSVYHGKDGFGDILKDDIDTSIVKKTPAVQAMYDFVNKYPKQVTFMLIGPLTNFALCLLLYPDFAEKVKDVFIMGGNINGKGNASHSAEFNFHTDPEAAFIVLDRTPCPITILPWEACLDFTKDVIPMDWRFNVLGSVNSSTNDLMNPVEKSVYIPKGSESWMPCDAILAALYLFPDTMIKKKSQWYATVELHGEFTRGQVVLNHKSDKNKSSNVCFIEHVCVETFKNIALWTVNHDDIQAI